MVISFFLLTGVFRLRRTRESSIHKNPLESFETMPYSLQAQQKQQQRIRSLEVPKLRIQNVDMLTGRIWLYLVVSYAARYELQIYVSGVHGCKASKTGAWRIWSVSGAVEEWTCSQNRTWDWLWKSDMARRFLWLSDQPVGTNEVFEKGDWSLRSESFSLYLHSVVLDLLCLGSNLVSNIKGGIVVFRAFLIGVPMQISNMLGETVVEVFNLLEKPTARAEPCAKWFWRIGWAGPRSTWMLETLPIAAVFLASMWSLSPLRYQWCVSLFSLQPCCRRRDASWNGSFRQFFFGACGFNSLRTWCLGYWAKWECPTAMSLRFDWMIKWVRLNQCAVDRDDRDDGHWSKHGKEMNRVPSGNQTWQWKIPCLQRPPRQRVFFVFWWWSMVVPCEFRKILVVDPCRP